ncbi:MAG: aminotransferase class III-fold pyridoxal phosphate-dependent enzyme, partial [Clostridia bacterium]|nr:aminotransferase class III-fold pyridoxal phosphate-dependent enzyme [Clostridia bacterium]
MRARPHYGGEGEGSYLYDTEGRRYVDFCAGIATCSLGHCHPAVVQALCTQAGTLMHCSNLYNIPQQEELATLIVEKMIGIPGRIFFCNSGAADGNNQGKCQNDCQQFFHGDDLLSWSKKRGIGANSRPRAGLCLLGSADAVLLLEGADLVLESTVYGSLSACVDGGELTLVLHGLGEGLEHDAAQRQVVGQDEGVIEVVVDDIDDGGGLLIVYALHLEALLVVHGNEDLGGLAVEHLDYGGDEGQIGGGSQDGTHLGGIVGGGGVLLIRREEHGVRKHGGIALHLTEDGVLQGAQTLVADDEALVLGKGGEQIGIGGESHAGAIVVEESAHGVGQLVSAVALVKHHGGVAVLVAGDEGGITADREGDGAAPELRLHEAELVALVLGAVEVLVHVHIRDDLVHLLIGPLEIGDHVVELVGLAVVVIQVDLLVEQEQMGIAEDVDEIVACQDVLIAVHEAEVIHIVLVPVGTLEVEDAILVQDVAEVALDEQLGVGVDIVDDQIVLVGARGGEAADIGGDRVVGQIDLGELKLHAQELFHLDVTLQHGVVDQTAVGLAGALDEEVGVTLTHGRDVGAGVDTEFTAVVVDAVEAV